MDVNCPTIDQRIEPDSQGRAPLDGNMDCVPVSLASMAAGLLGTPQDGTDYHNAVYGASYTGLQDPARYVGLLAGKGLTLTPYTGTPADLIAAAAQRIVNREPVLLSIPSDWGDNPPTSQYAHMVAGCDVPDGNTLTAMNPWGGFYQTQSLAWWQERLATCAYKAIWVMARAGGSSGGGPVGVPSGWHDDGTTLTAPNGVIINGYIRQHIVDRVPPWPAELQPVALMYGTADGWEEQFAASVIVAATHAGATSERPGPDYPAEIAAANARITQLENTPAAPTDPAAEAALTALISLKSTLAEIPG